MILKTSIKYWPAEYHSQERDRSGHVPARADWRSRQIKSVRIESHDASVDIIGSEPEKWNRNARKLPTTACLHHQHRLIDGEVTDKQFQPERFMDPKIWKFLENRDGATQRRAQLALRQGGGQHRACHARGWADPDQARGLPVRQRLEPGERQTAGRKIQLPWSCPSWARRSGEDYWPGLEAG